MIDYEELLRKYMAHVISCDGSSFLDSIEYIGFLSQSDNDELKEIEKEILKQHFNGKATYG